LFLEPSWSACLPSANPIPQGFKEKETLKKDKQIVMPGAIFFSSPSTCGDGLSGIGKK
jgi:hypothetical protein